MFESSVATVEAGARALPDAAAAALAHIRTGITALLDLDLVTVPQGALLELLHSVEVEKRRLPAVDHRLIHELDDRQIAFEVCQSSTASLLVGVLRISPTEAKQRVTAAANLGPRRGLTGIALPPLFGRVAAAQVDGLISAEQASVITEAIDALPHAVQAEHETQVEADLLEHAQSFDPQRLRRIARHLADVLDPDGTLADYADHERRRDLTLTCNRDGSYHLSGRLTPLCGAIWRPILDCLSQPVPAVDGARDDRRPGQRRADGFEQAGLLVTRAEQLPRTAGAAVTLLVSISDDQLADGRGLATTGHGDLIPVQAILDLAGEAQTVGVRLNSTGGVMSYGQAERIVPRPMRLAITARDRGCTFPGCSRPAAWCEAHHFIAYIDRGPTSIDNCGLVCGFHHRNFAKCGWQGVFIDERPHWIPPAFLDPDQVPIRNTYFDVQTGASTPAARCQPRTPRDVP